MADKPQTVFVRSNFENARLHYILQYIFAERLEIDYSLNSKQIPESSIIIGYGNHESTIFNIPDSGYLQMDGVPDFLPEVKLTNNVTLSDSHDNNDFSSEKNSELYRSATTTKNSHFLEKDVIELFPAEKDEINLSFDLFSAVFFMLSRHEEYLSTETDQHGRFDVQHTLAFRNGFHQRAVVDEWIILLREKLQPFFADTELKKEKAEFSLTIDVDQVFSYRCKGLVRNAGGWFRDLITGRFGAFLKRPAVLLGFSKDPFDTFETIENLGNRHQIPLQYFILSATERCDFDKNGKIDCSKAVQILNSIKEPGLHPSYDCLNNDDKLNLEKLHLETICKTTITKARRHFLRMRLPESYHQLLQAGFTDDYTMGFASGIGFRAGTSRPFRFFDLQTDEVLSLTVHPFCVMDGSLKDYSNLSLAHSEAELNKMAAYIQSIGGRFEMLIHNETLSESRRWKGWTRMLEKTIHKFQNPTL